ncbi:MAG TPA: bifunctional glutamine-synthetase adenylyltransferase/deadenyltransferase, partial [Candidatus Limnocylindria bacterium]|nr:bifunctional glutamine-synthetase adenylyltransferase/deadenyltransferase [Candidatus Limnocylindria bacterium]
MTSGDHSTRSSRRTSTAGRLVRLGFADAAAAGDALAHPALRDLMESDERLLLTLAAAADPDLALTSLVRIFEGAPDRDRAALTVALLDVDGPVLDRLVAVLGASLALGDHLARHPDHWAVLAPDEPLSAGAVRRELLAAVGASPELAEPVAALVETAGHDALRRTYRRRLLAVAGRDLTGLSGVGATATALAELADATLEAALAIARGELPADVEPCRLAVVAMGKCGGLELNYVSDVDVLFVAEPVAGGDETAALATATRLATALMRACSVATGEGEIWPVDAGLRPEGRQGALVRTLASYTAYYDRWASTWEFQALLKARPVAGDLVLGAAFADAVAPQIWEAADRPDFVEDVQAMRRRVEEHVPAKEADRQLKLGRGGLRDVEFAVQLLQLV